MKINLIRSRCPEMIKKSQFIEVFENCGKFIVINSRTAQAYEVDQKTVEVVRCLIEGRDLIELEGVISPDLCREICAELHAILPELF